MGAGSSISNKRKHSRSCSFENESPARVIVPPTTDKALRVRTLSSLSDKSLEVLSTKGKVREMYTTAIGTTMSPQKKSKMMLPPAPPSFQSENSPLETRTRRLRRSNSTNSMFVSSTLGFLDHQSLLICVSAVIQSHIRIGKPNMDDSAVATFIDKNPPKLHADHVLPRSRDIRKFISYIYERGQLEPEVLIMALVYFERLVYALQRGKHPTDKDGAFGDGGLQPGGKIDMNKRKRTRTEHIDVVDLNRNCNSVVHNHLKSAYKKDTRLLMNPNDIHITSNQNSEHDFVVCSRFTWRPMVLISLILASKVWDDLSMINADFSQICGRHFSLQQINRMELLWLAVMKYECKVSLSTYAKYYFKLRVMLGTAGLKNNSLLPLSIKEAVKIKQIDKEYGADSHLGRTASVLRLENDKLRSASLDNFSFFRNRSLEKTDQERQTRKLGGVEVGACLEQLVQPVPQMPNVWSKC